MHHDLKEIPPEKHLFDRGIEACPASDGVEHVLGVEFSLLVLRQIEESMARPDDRIHQRLGHAMVNQLYKIYSNKGNAYISRLGLRYRYLIKCFEIQEEAVKRKTKHYHEEAPIPASPSELFDLRGPSIVVIGHDEREIDDGNRVVVLSIYRQVVVGRKSIAGRDGS